MTVDSPLTEQVGAEAVKTESIETLVHSEIDNGIKDTSNI